MARSLIRVELELDRIVVHDEGDGWGDAEPYLWTVFFKVDGETVSVTDALSLSGAPTVVTTPGSHGNLGTSDADEGDTIVIPSVIGEWSTILKPIPTPDSLSALVEDVGGVVGVVAILMEEDNVSDDGAEAGHRALNEAVRNALQQIVDTRSFSNQDVSDAEIEAFTDEIKTKIKDAIVDNQNFLENFWSWLNPDDTIGTKVWVFKHDDLDPGTVINFSQRWRNEGDWEIFGHISSTVLCPADAVANFFASLQETAVRQEAIQSVAKIDSQTILVKILPEDCHTPQFDLQALRRFRDTEYRKRPELAKWFALAERHTARFIYLLATDQSVRKSAHALLTWLPHMTQALDQLLSEEHLVHAERILQAFYRQKSRRARIDASRALAVLPLLKGKSVKEAMSILAQIQPARHPSVSGTTAVRLCPPPKNGKPVSVKVMTNEENEEQDQARLALIE
ncbi:MAG: hypothetical protein D6706_08440 [Chloroflexi bacterium]|nr:MAG: hypothetical protein D6706_08440 [Chloroflexota bacterium]